MRKNGLFSKWCWTTEQLLEGKQKIVQMSYHKPDEFEIDQTVSTKIR